MPGAGRISVGSARRPSGPLNFFACKMTGGGCRQDRRNHVKGREWAGKHIVLEPWQCFILAVVFGWVRKTDGLRRFREIYAEIPRKSGKSVLGACIGLYMFAADGEPGAEVYSGATSEKQAWEVFGPARQMCLKNPSFVSHFGIHVGAKNLHILDNASKFEPVIGKPGDGASPHCAIVDEYHEHQTPDLYDTMDEIRELLEEQHKAFEEFKQANDDRLAAIEKKGFAPADLEEKVARINEDLTRLGKDLAEVAKKANRPGAGADGLDPMPAHKVGRLWKFKTNEVDEWVKAGGAADHNRKGSDE